MKSIDAKIVGDVLKEWGRQKERCKKYGHDEIIYLMSQNGVTCECRRCHEFYTRTLTHEEWKKWDIGVHEPVTI